MHTSILNHIEALHEQLEQAAIDDDPVNCLEIALLLLDVYERLLDEHNILIINYGEYLH